MTDPTIPRDAGALLNPAQRSALVTLSGVESTDLERMAAALDDWADSGEPARPDHLRVLAAMLHGAAAGMGPRDGK
jgi:hypothetical protein